MESNRNPRLHSKEPTLLQVPLQYEKSASYYKKSKVVADGSSQELL